LKIHGKLEVFKTDMVAHRRQREQGEPKAGYPTHYRRVPGTWYRYQVPVDLP
jgi:hypothetical protein